jgi:hypothetical protein
MAEKRWIIVIDTTFPTIMTKTIRCENSRLVIELYFSFSGAMYLMPPISGLSDAACGDI